MNVHKVPPKPEPTREIIFQSREKGWLGMVGSSAWETKMEEAMVGFDRGVSTLVLEMAIARAVNLTPYFTSPNATPLGRSQS